MSFLKWFAPMKSFFGEKPSHIYSKKLPIELANTDHIKMISLRDRESANIGEVAQCKFLDFFSTYPSNIQEHLAKQYYDMLIS